MTRRIRAVSLLVAIVALGGACAPRMDRWQRSGAAVDDLTRDHHACVMQAESVTGPVPTRDGLLGIWANRERVNELYRPCMKARGYEER